MFLFECSLQQATMDEKSGRFLCSIITREGALGYSLALKMVPTNLPSELELI